MQGLVTAYIARRNRELKDLGAVIVHAFHEPGKLDDLLPDKQPDEPVLMGERWWE